MALPTQSGVVHGPAAGVFGLPTWLRWDHRGSGSNPDARYWHVQDRALGRRPVRRGRLQLTHRPGRAGVRREGEARARPAGRVRQGHPAVRPRRVQRVREEPQVARARAALLEVHRRVPATSRAGGSRGPTLLEFLRRS